MLFASGAGAVTSSDRWHGTWGALGVAAGDAAEYAMLITRYDEPHRHYHTRRHLDECFAHLDPVRAFAERVGEVELALWYHDAVYEPRRADNEARSADLAGSALSRAGAIPVVQERVRALILATRHDTPPSTPDEALLVDIDLAILAADDARFDEYERQVREEYAWVPTILFRHKRRAILEGFLARQRICASGRFPEWEARARANLVRSLAKL